MCVILYFVAGVHVPAGIPPIGPMPCEQAHHQYDLFMTRDPTLYPVIRPAPSKEEQR